MDYLVHAWDVKGFVKVDKDLRDIVRHNLRIKYGSLYKAENTLKLADYHHRLLHKRFKRIDILFKITDCADIPRGEAEKHIYRFIDHPCDKEGYNIKFPIKITPLHIRIASHVIGDGCAYKNGKCTIFSWTQNNTQPLKSLENIVIGKSLKRKPNGTGGECIGLPKIIMKLVCSILKLDVNNFNRIKFLTLCLTLPKDFKVEVLTAIVEDEGSIDKNRIIIRMKGKTLMKLISRLIDSLGYERSKLKSYTAETKWGRVKMYRLEITPFGIRKYHKDLEHIGEEYGNLAGLWTKRLKLEEAVSRRLRLIGDIRNRKFSKILMLTNNKNSYITPKNLIVKFKLKPNDIYSLLRYMNNKKYIERVQRGMYKFK